MKFQAMTLWDVLVYIHSRQGLYVSTRKWLIEVTKSRYHPHYYVSAYGNC